MCRRLTDVDVYRYRRKGRPTRCARLIKARGLNNTLTHSALTVLYSGVVLCDRDGFTCHTCRAMHDAMDTYISHTTSHTCDMPCRVQTQRQLRLSFGHMHRCLHRCLHRRTMHTVQHVSMPYPCACTCRAARRVPHSPQHETTTLCARSVPPDTRRHDHKETWAHGAACLGAASSDGAPPRRHLSSRRPTTAVSATVGAKRMGEAALWST